MVQDTAEVFNWSVFIHTMVLLALSNYGTFHVAILKVLEIFSCHIFAHYSK